MLTRRGGASCLAIVSVSLLVVFKAVASVLTGSISIRADAIHSAIDLFGVVIGYIGIRISGKPPDERHRFGHGKAESLAAAVIAALIFLAAAAISYEAVKRLVTGAAIEMVALGIYVTTAAIVINGAAAWYVFRVARAEDSLALEATGRDMLADVWSSCAVLVGLVMVNFTGLIFLDSVVALLVAALIARSACLTLRRSLSELVDVRLPEAEEDIIKSVISEHGRELVGFHALRTRRAGRQRYIDLHLVVPKDISVEQAHQLCDCIEAEIEKQLRSADVTIHIEPCPEDCDRCPEPCKWRDRDA